MPRQLSQNSSYLFKILFIEFNWQIITLQYCDGFHHTWIGHRYTRLMYLDNITGGSSKFGWHFHFASLLNNLILLPGYRER